MQKKEKKRFFFVKTGAVKLIVEGSEASKKSLLNGRYIIK